MLVTADIIGNPRQFVTAPGIGQALSQISGERGDDFVLDFQFDARDGAGGTYELDPAGSPSLTSFIFGAKRQGDLRGDFVVSNWNGSAYAWSKVNGSTFTDGVTATNYTLTSATAVFTAADVGLSVAGAGIPLGTTIASVQSATSCTLSAATTATASGITITITGRATTYRVVPSLNSVELNDLLIDGTIAATPADETARYALTGLALGTIVRQLDNQTYWKVIDITHLADSAGWSTDVPVLPSIPLDCQIEIVLGGNRISTAKASLYIENDVVYGGEGVPTSANPSYYTESQVDTLLALKASLDGSGNVLIGTHARLVPISGGVKIQLSADGVTWQDGPSYVAS